ncbi:NAD(P)/FAD-dependent oxidoreductase [Rhodococcus sp. HM1]|uniref:flavin-containing monooxygenase n=1 Tax=unclassified Rhodococcus (in: high G+C Gram-positive bacteria) TaxID=192944 RepID=UPI0018CEA397|nr:MULTISPECIES: NAD(P)/FAD-dependent oxidoreductase [unclassified Rhodococcus (in: high G+C Gram-positive bacteria)]MBH0119135.1 NAD(P)/FAD-dependent oxidoreductase [Rhodococcus sp. CX]MCK8672460.1 NAD(P)/FAD-dependent oxidoreductase [Rhodococcus sp. HM1]
MPETLTPPGPQPEGFDPDWVRAKHTYERAKRLRRDGVEQYIEVTADFSHYEDDPYTERVERDPVNDEVEILMIGAGLGSLIAAARMREAGLDGIRLVDRAGGVGGTWYWNRYPGVQCDIESYIYMPLLEELNYIPTQKYAYGSEIREHLTAIADKYDLVRDALFHTTVKEMVWDDEAERWIVKTDRGDRIRARIVVVSPGSLTRPKLPGIPGINEFEGHTFHTSRWDYGYTGGDESGGLTGLQDKSVGLIGTGATGLQVVPHLGRWAGKLYVFQRTPNAVDERGNKPTDPQWAASLRPGWQRERMENFTRYTAGVEHHTDLVDDGWTRVSAEVTKTAIKQEIERRGAPMTPEEIAEFLFEADFRSMERVRARIDAIVTDKATAEALKPWYKRLCKRVGFHDEFLPTFNRDNVELVDTDGRGIQSLTRDGVVVGDREYKVDALIFATGYDVSSSYTRRTGFDIIGRDGVHLSDKWKSGPRTFHGLQSNGFPNCFFLGYTQTGVANNYTHTAEERARHLVYLLEQRVARGATTIEADLRAEDAWVATMNELAGPSRAFYADCTPSYLDNEGDIGNPDGLAAANYGGGPVQFFELLARWREDGEMDGVTLR